MNKKLLIIIVILLMALSVACESTDGTQSTHRERKIPSNVIIHNDYDNIEVFMTTKGATVVKVILPDGTVCYHLWSYDGGISCNFKNAQ